MIEFHPCFGDIYVSSYTGNIGVFLKNGDEFFTNNIDKLYSSNIESAKYISFVKSWYEKNIM